MITVILSFLKMFHLKKTLHYSLKIFQKNIFFIFHFPNFDRVFTLWVAYMKLVNTFSKKKIKNKPLILKKERRQRYCSIVCTVTTEKTEACNNLGSFFTVTKFAVNWEERNIIYLISDA